MKKHPIQLKELRVLKLHIEISENYLPGLDNDEKNESLKLYTALVKHKVDEDKFAIKIKATSEKSEEKDLPYHIEVELAGAFEADLERFKLEHISEWARVNGALILYPYIREHVYALTQRAGMDGVLLPLLQIPVFSSLAKDSSN